MNTQDQSFRSCNSSQSETVTPKPKSGSRRFDEAIAVAARYRHLVPRKRSILFFGTKNPRNIIRDDELRAFDPLDNPAISFARLFHVAVHFAMPHRDDEEATGAVFIFDRELLSTRYRLEPYYDPIFDDNKHSASETEERIEVGAIGDLKRYLLGVIWLREDEKYPSRPRRRRNKHRAAYDLDAGCCRKRMKATASLSRLFRMERVQDTELT